MSFRLRLGEDGVGYRVEGTEGGADGSFGRGADGRVGSVCGGGGGGDRQGHQSGGEGGLMLEGSLIGVLGAGALKAAWLAGSYVCMFTW